MEIGHDQQVFHGSAPRQLMVSLKTGMAEGPLPYVMGLAGDYIQGDKVVGHVVEHDEKRKQYDLEVELLDKEALPHGSTPMHKGRCINNLSLEEEEAALDSSKSNVAPHKWTRRARNLSPSHNPVQVGKRGYDEVAITELVSSEINVKRGRMEVDDPTSMVQAVADHQPRQSQ